ncbi:MAG: IS110 family transposase [Betaproteobacteria bacterium]|nr:IS110 family transposase [Betaproteobacteria bacterium]
MYYVGIDVGKNNHVASMMDASRKPVFKAFAFANTREGAESLLEKIQLHAPDQAQIEIGMEATGHYWLALYSFLFDAGYVLHVINPIQTDGWRKGVEIRKRKTDDIDSLLIADLIRYGGFVETKLTDESLLSLRTLTRFRSYQVDSIADLKRKVICVLDQVFPEYESVFSEVFGTTSKEVLLTYSTPAELESVSVEQLTELLTGLSRRKCGAAQAQRLSHAAAHSFGVTFCRDTFSFQLRSLLEQMNFIEQQVADTERQIKAIMDTLASPITTITGIGPVLGAVILGEFGDISRFDSGSKLVAFAGIDASVSQSGQYESTNNRMSKRGSPYLRRALYQAAMVAAFHDPELSAFYQKKRAEGKHHSVCVGAVARKLCYIIFAVLKENRPYVKRQP